MTHSPQLPSFLFVCTGNICRSPLADLAMRREAEKRGLALDIDSAGTGDWHIGDLPDPRARETARRHGLNASILRARQVTKNDFDRFTHIIALDRSHLKALKRLKPAHSQAEIFLLLDEVEGRRGEDVVDPYFGSAEGFETTWHDVEAGCRALAHRLLDPLTPSK
ncbi:low molecular weight phosphotyrosine protein phosphatase [Saccharibacter sp. 17.LH.SD]|uniref:low molecular weight protein-tyrosine-phosphatase n=1 Tax=Saccharibacter sp. 17.LH.SD TaxID=2689393 RepID=UPI0013709D46|nr:low molecular weight protein-tyrosine-phosphatase [Saccharibacter sp. 17.LH.SD]MXV44870.1 low molecular weight phosphotyrosine protein phosphatase [Saccharibacter sp. 17.LH.SD]